jgi:putative protein-disulfide isomerase
MTTQLLYFANPMCSWCWGFAPVLDGLERAFGDGLAITLGLGALGDRGRPMRAEDKAYVRSHWEHVHERSGQPFDWSFFEREGFVYDTAPPSRAVMAVRELRPAATLAYFRAVQRAFYAEGRDVTTDAVLLDLAPASGVEPATLATALADPGLVRRLEDEQLEVARMGVTGYPTLMALAAGRPQLLALGWRPLAEVEAALRRLMAA